MTDAPDQRSTPDLRMLPPAELAAGLRGLADHRDAGNLSAIEAALLREAATYIAGATDSLREHMAEVRKLRAALAEYERAMKGAGK